MIFDPTLVNEYLAQFLSMLSGFSSWIVTIIIGGSVLGILMGFMRRR
jgi:hypothetical protein